LGGGTLFNLSLGAPPLKRMVSCLYTTWCCVIAARQEYFALLRRSGKESLAAFKVRRHTPA
jgi:hypothetical protein